MTGLKPGGNEALVSEVAGFALEFGFVPPYTSLFVELPGLAGPEPDDTVNEEVAEEMEMPVEEVITLEEEAIPSSSAGQGAYISSSYDRNAVYEEGLAEEPIEEESTPGFGAFLTLSGLLGIAFYIRKK